MFLAIMAWILIGNLSPGSVKTIPIQYAKMISTPPMSMSMVHQLAIRVAVVQQVRGWSGKASNLFQSPVFLHYLALDSQGFSFFEKENKAITSI